MVYYVLYSSTRQDETSKKHTPFQTGRRSRHQRRSRCRSAGVRLLRNFEQCLGNAATNDHKDRRKTLRSAQLNGGRTKSQKTSERLGFGETEQNIEECTYCRIPGLSYGTRWTSLSTGKTVLTASLESLRGIPSRSVTFK
jgi:hypothetical protein